MLWMLSRCRPWRQHSDNTGTKHIWLTKKLDMFATRSKLMNVVWMLSPETTFGQNKCFWPFSKAENIYFEPKKGEKHFFCPNVVSMLSQCCLQRQHSDNICILFKNLGHVCTSQPKLSECCLQRQHSDNICKKLFLWKILDMFATPAQSCLNVVSRDNIQTTLRQHNICKKKLLWTILDMFATRSQSCLNVVSRDNIQTTFREHSNNIGTKHFFEKPWACLQLTANVAWRSCADKLPCSHKLCCWSLRATKTNMHSDANTKHWPWWNITQQVVSKKEHLVTCANRRSCADIVWGLADCGLTLVYWGTAEWDNNNIWSGVCKTKTNGAKWSWNYAIKEGYHWHIGCSIVLSHWSYR